MRLRPIPLALALCATLVTSALAISSCGKKKSSDDDDAEELTQEQKDAIALIAACTGIDEADVEYDADLTVAAGADWCDAADKMALPAGEDQTADPAEL